MYDFVLFSQVSVDFKVFPTTSGPFSDFALPLLESSCSEDGGGLAGLGGFGGIARLR